MTDGSGFIKNWTVGFSKGRNNGMPHGQKFLIQRITGPGRTYFKIVPTGPPTLAHDWTEAELELEGGELKHCFTKVDVLWTIALQPGGKSIVAKGTRRCDGVHPVEEPGEWDASDGG